MNPNSIKILPFSNELAPYFKQINLLWIEQFFEPEAEDLVVLNDPRDHLIDKGGDILFAEYQGKIVGTCGLKKWSETEFELVKMGVLEGYQGLHIGQKLGEAILETAKLKGCERLFLETNQKLTPAINLYYKLGFNPFESQESRCDYQRCDLYMEQFLP